MESRSRRRLPEADFSARPIARERRAHLRPRRGADDSGDIESTRERILSAAGRILAEQGFETASMRVIAKASGITPGAVYKHFNSKADLLFEVTKRAVQSIPLFTESSRDGADAARLPTLAAAYTEPELKLLRQLSIEMHAASARDRKVSRVLARSDEHAIRQTAAAIERAQRSGKLDPKLDPMMVASAFSVFMMGLVHMETLIPHLVGDRTWSEFVRNRAAALLGVL